MKIFITGYHRAGTHEAANVLAEMHSFPLFYEEAVEFDSIELMQKINKENPNGYILHCPGLSHKVLLLANIGKVYWCDRSRLDIIASMRNGGMTDMLWHIVKGFYNEFPGDPIWTTIEYDGSVDNHYGFVKYGSLLCSVKSYFFDKYFSDKAEVIVLEKQPYYNGSETLAGKKPLKKIEEKIVLDGVAAYESFCMGQK